MTDSLPDLRQAVFWQNTRRKWKVEEQEGPPQNREEKFH